MASTLKCWIDKATGNVYHDKCFEPGESKVGFTEADLNQLPIDAACESCNGQIFGDVDDEDADVMNRDDENEEKAGA